MKRLDADYFERVYAKEHDPWGFATRWYEKRKYALTMSALPQERYARAFEPGCAIGVLTELLADRCDSLIASEPIARIADRARERLRGREHVEVRTGFVPDDWPEGTFDLVMLSEVAYYLNGDGLDELMHAVDGSLRPGGHVVAVHWTGETDYPLTGSEVHRRFDARWDPLVRHREPEFMLSVHERKGRP